jgi:hypothetical protein
MAKDGSVAASDFEHRRSDVPSQWRRRPSQRVRRRCMTELNAVTRAALTLSRHFTISEKPRFAHSVITLAVVTVVALVTICCGGETAKSKAPTVTSDGQPISSATGGSTSSTPSQPNVSTAKPGGRPTPTRVSFFDQLKATGSVSHLHLDRALPGSTCTARVTVSSNGEATAKDLGSVAVEAQATADFDISDSIDAATADSATWTAECILRDREQPQFVVYRAATVFITPPPTPSESATASPSATATPTPPPPTTRSAPPSGSP